MISFSTNGIVHAQNIEARIRENTGIISHESINIDQEMNDINYFSDNPIVDNDLMIIADELRNLKVHGATDDELNVYAKKRMEETEVKLSRETSDLDSYITGNLNAQEQALYNSNVAYGLLCMANGKLAIGYAEDNYISSVLHNGNGDAFRHTLWNFGMVIDVGYNFAKSWSDAHENGTVNNPALEKQMDLYNNSVGLNLGLTYPGTVLHSTFINTTKTQVRNGKCKIIVNSNLQPSNSSGEK